MKYLLDTNVCIQLLRSRKGETVRRRLNSITIEDVAVCAPVRHELVYGALRSVDPEGAMRGLASFVGQFRSLPFDDPAADRAAEVRVHLAARGVPIGPVDVQIAGIALASGLVLVTHNYGEFSRVPDLRIEDWEQLSP